MIGPTGPRTRGSGWPRRVSSQADGWRESFRLHTLRLEQQVDRSQELRQRLHNGGFSEAEAEAGALAQKAEELESLAPPARGAAKHAGIGAASHGVRGIGASPEPLRCGNTLASFDPPIATGAGESPCGPSKPARPYTAATALNLSPACRIRLREWIHRHLASTCRAPCRLPGPRTAPESVVPQCWPVWCC